MTTTAQRLRMYCGPHGQAVSQVTGLSKARISWLIYELGLEWLHKEGLDRLAHVRAFWRDWQYSWYSADADYLARVYAGEALRYEAYHRHRIYAYCLDQAVVQTIKQQLKHQSYD